MGLNFRKTIRLGKYLRLNVGKNGVGVSVGGKLLRLNHSATGKTSATVRLPGTGLSYTQNLDELKTKDSK